jgi:methylmalonyl-CoA/ethylmalonyl-CoA epimerase
MLLGDGRVELLRPLGDDTPVGKFLQNRGPGMHHMALRVDDIEQALADAAAAGAELIDQQPRVGLFGLRVAFIHPHSVHGVLVELVQPANEGNGHG